MFKLFAAFVATAVAEDATIFLADNGAAASMWQDEREFEAGVRKVLQEQTADLEKMVAAHPKSMLLQTEIATQKVESLADTIHLAADASKTFSKNADGLNACNYARAGALEAYANVDRIVNGVGGAVAGAGGYPQGGYNALASQADALWEQVKATTLRCKIIGDASVMA